MTMNRDKKLADLLRQHAELTERIEAEQAVQKAAAIEQIRALMAEHEITVLEIEGRKRRHYARQRTRPQAA
ncbi:H-NS family nucleoid-associated regulatory protein [Burkholderia ubonensis]|uniref:H-NS family nucleoid-associated regulatory protein n=1 Tax=Burkholderia ubonensis TaxID=101571 RepID=UPI000B2C1083|nr:H-NS family nucleoid-associated regulatory protein [Burkholderia ubonensis]